MHLCMTESELANNFAWLHVGHRCSSSKMKAHITIMLHSEIGNYVNIAATQFSPLSVCLSVFPISTQSWFSLGGGDSGVGLVFAGTHEEVRELGTYLTHPWKNKPSLNWQQARDPWTCSAGRVAAKPKTRWQRVHVGRSPETWSLLLFCISVLTAEVTAGGQEGERAAIMCLKPRLKETM